MKRSGDVVCSNAFTAHFSFGMIISEAEKRLVESDDPKPIREMLRSFISHATHGQRELERFYPKALDAVEQP
jgi:hypothetical protein